MGGKFSVDFLAPSGSGENVLVTCENGDYAADGDIAEAVPRAPEFRRRASTRPRRSRRRESRRCEALADFLGIDLAATSKAMPVTKPDGTVVLALVRGDDRLSEMKLFDALPGDVAAGDRGGDPGRVRRERRLARPCRLRRRGDRRPDAARGAVRRGREPRRVPPARRRGTGATTSRASPTCASPREGDRCPRCGGALRFQTAVEVGHIFNFGSFYSGRSPRRSSTRTARRSRSSAAATGSGRAASWRRSSSSTTTSDGIVWPAAVAPYDVARRRAAGRGGDRRRRPPRRCRPQASTCFSTTATSERARSSPTPT